MNRSDYIIDVVVSLVLLILSIVAIHGWPEFRVVWGVFAVLAVIDLVGSALCLLRLSRGDSHPTTDWSEIDGID